MGVRSHLYLPLKDESCFVAHIATCPFPLRRFLEPHVDSRRAPAAPPCDSPRGVDRPRARHARLEPVRF